MNKMVSFIIVTFNSEKTVKNCLVSIEKFCKISYEIIVVDNNSTDKTVLEIEKCKIAVKILKQQENLGFSKANNLGFKNSSGDYIFFLNPDTVLVKPIEAMVKYLTENQTVGLIAPKLLERKNKTQSSVRKLPSLAGVIKEYYLGQKNTYNQYVPASKEAIEVEAVYGAAMILKREVFQKLGGFDERYFLYYEDLDLCKRIKQLGLKIVYYPKIPIMHVVGESMKSISKNSHKLNVFDHFFPNKNTGSYYYLIKSGNIYHGFLMAFLIRLLIYFAAIAF